MRIWLIVSLVAGLLGFGAWLSDYVTPQGERTVYSAECRDGAWAGSRCLGRLAAGERFRFRALKAHREVLFWTVGSVGEPSGKFDDCSIQDGRNWTCKPTADLARTITHQMARGCPVRDSSGRARAFHQVPKWRWLLLSAGLPAGSEAP